MKDEEKTKGQLISELVELRQRIAEWENAETEGKRAEEALRESQAELFAIYDLAPIAMILVDRERRVRKVNGATVLFAGRPAQEMIGLRGGEALRCLHSLDDPEGCGFGPFCQTCPVRLTVLDTFETGRTHDQAEVRLPFAREGREEETDLLVSTSRISVPQHQRVLVCVEDITERKRAEEAMRTSAQQWHATFDAISDAISLLDSEGRFVRCNKAMTQLVGKPSTEVIGHLCWELMHGTSEPIAGCPVARMRETRKRESLLLPVGDRWLSVAVDPLLDEDGNLIGAVHIMSDITERKRMEEEKERAQAQLLQAQKMNAIGILVSGVAHEFNNLLGAIQGYAELAVMQVDEPDPLHADLQKIVRIAERGGNLTDQLLLYGRKHPMEPTLLNLNRTVGHLLEMVNRLIGEDIAINVDLEPDLWTVRADEASIEQMIMNLAVNAREAMPEGGELAIKGENVTLDEEDCKAIPQARPGKFVCLSVADTGVGMDEEIMQRIFEPFFTTKEVGKGAGLGLSVVYGIVKQHEGWINVYSEPGQGSTFKVYLPALTIKPEGEIEETISLQDLQGSGERILLVEDEEDVRGSLTRALGENGYIVFGAANAKEAIDIFEREKREFHLVFTDVVLPDLDGLQLVDQLLSRNPQLGVLLSSGYTDDRSQWPVIRERGFPFLQKPYSLVDLLQATRDAMESS